VILKDERIGNQRLILGDCREIIGGLEFDAICTDPPYGIAWSKPFIASGNSRAHDGILNDADVSVRDAVISSAKRAIVFGSFQAPFPPKVRQVLIWQKPGDAGLFGTVAGYRRDVEPIFICGEWPRKPVTRSSVLHGQAQFRGHAAAEADHPHVKPVDLMIQLIEATSGVILDPFMGSGTTLVACQRSGRAGIGIELDPKHFATACRRVDEAARQPDLLIPETRQAPVQEKLL
jgi:DNA modification methylase